mgnify:CR=1 FL=1
MPAKTTASIEAKKVVLNLPELVEGLSFTGETVKIPRLEVPAIRVSYKAEDDDTKVSVSLPLVV